MVEVFKTNVEDPIHAKTLIHLLSEQFPGSRVNFDLQDCDRILRIEGQGFIVEKVVSLVGEKGFYCECLAD